MQGTYVSIKRTYWESCNQAVQDCQANLFQSCALHNLFAGVGICDVECVDLTSCIRGQLGPANVQVQVLQGCNLHRKQEIQGDVWKLPRNTTPVNHS